MQIQVLEMNKWETPASRYEKKVVGDYMLHKKTNKSGYYAYHGIDGYTMLYVRYPYQTTILMQQREGRLSWREWMVDSPTDYRAMQKYAEAATGRVLTTGLGLGLVTHELCKNPTVTDITVVEISPNVVELVSGYLPHDERIHIIVDDFWKFVEKDRETWDCIIVDIWVYYGREQQIEQYVKEIVPANVRLREKYPTAKLFFHGFAGMPTLDELEKTERAGDDTNPLIYGLGGNHAQGHT